MQFNGLEMDLIDIVRDELNDQGISRTDLRFGIDDAGELYYTTKQDGMIRSLVPQALLGDYNGDGFVSQANSTWSC